MSKKFLSDEYELDSFEDPLYRFKRLRQAIKKCHMDLRGLRLLDLGCHQGQFIKLMIAKDQVIATGIDDWDPALKTAGSWDYFKKDLAKGIGLQQSFDVVSALEVIEHMVDTDFFLKECYAYLKKGGYLLLTTPNINNLRNRFGVFMGKYPNFLEYRNVIHHVRLYNPDVLKEHLKKHHFKIILVWGVSFLPVKLFRHSWILMNISQWLAELWPSFCNNIIVICQKNP